MKVRDLIKILRKMNKDAEVVFADENGYFQETSFVSTVDEKKKNLLYVDDNEEIIEVG